MIEYLILAVLSGILVKMVDYLDDDSKNSHIVKWPLAIGYGSIIGYLISQSPFAMIFLGAALAQILARKVDTLTHKTGYLFMLLSLAYFGFPLLLLFPLFVFLVFASLDEFDRFIFFDKPAWVRNFRPFLILSALSFVALGQWQYLAGIIAFDIGYIGVEKMTRPKPMAKRKIVKKTKRRKKKK